MDEVDAAEAADARSDLIADMEEEEEVADGKEFIVLVYF